MPRHIIDEKTGKSTRVWDKSEWEARYKHGRQDAGDRTGYDKIHSVDVLREHFENGVSKAHNLLTAMVRAGFEHGWRQGEDAGKVLEKKESAVFVQQEIKKAEIRGLNQAKLEDEQRIDRELSEYRTQLGHEFDTFESKYKENFEYYCNREKNTIINQYEQDNAWHNRAVRAYDQFMATRQNGYLHSALNVLGSLPLGVNNNSYPVRKIQLSDVRTIPGSVFLRFTGRYLLLPFVVYQTGRYFYNDYNIYVKKIAHGETDNQLQARIEVENNCKTLASLTPASFKLTTFTQKQKDDISACTSKCHAAQKFFGKKTTDNYDDTQNTIITPVSNVSIEIKQIVENLVKNGFYQHKNTQQGHGVTQEENIDLIDEPSDSYKHKHKHKHNGI